RGTCGWITSFLRMIFPSGAIRRGPHVHALHWRATEPRITPAGPPGPTGVLFCAALPGGLTTDHTDSTDRKPTSNCIDEVKVLLLLLFDSFYLCYLCNLWLAMQARSLAATRQAI